MLSQGVDKISTKRGVALNGYVCTYLMPKLVGPMNMVTSVRDVPLSTTRIHSRMMEAKVKLR